MDLDINVLLGKTLSNVVVNDNNDEILFTTIDGDEYLMYHDQDCCESVDIESIVGDIQDLVGEPILLAEEAVSDEHPEGAEKREWEDDSFTWTFYKLATRKGYVDIRWFGESNGYYSESVNFKQVKGE